MQNQNIVNGNTPGGRNDALTKEAGRLRAQGLDETEILDRLLNDPARDGLPESEVRTIARSIASKPAGEPRPDFSKTKFQDALYELATRRGFSVEVLKSIGAVAKGQEVHIPMTLAGEVSGHKRRRGDCGMIQTQNGPAKSVTVKGSRHGLMMPEPFPADGLVLLVEGEMDLCAALSAGHAATIGTPGSTPGRRVIEALQTRLAGREVVLVPDPDGPGDDWREMMGAALVHAGCKVRFIPAGDVDLDKRLKRASDPAAELQRLIGLAVEIKSPEVKPEWIGPRPNTDLGNAERFAEQHKGKVIYDSRHGHFRFWNGQYWALDSSGIIERLAHQTARSIYIEAANAPTPEAAQAISRHAARTESKERLKAMVEVARSLEGLVIDPAKFDADPWLFNCENGTIDLRTGQLRAHDKTDFITKISPVAFDPAARSDVCDRVLRDALDDDDAIRFLQKAAGYSLTGDTREEKLFAILGPEATCKSTQLEAMKAAMGDYAMTASFDTFTRKQGDGGIRNDVARLQGARLVACSEVNDGKAFDESLVKSLTGGDTVTARFLYREAFEFTPEFKLWLAANHAPKVDADDGAMWRRILRIPFERSIPKDRRDATIKPFLKDPEGGGPAVLAWMTQGCLLWQREGLKTPAKVEAATDAYRESQDQLNDFIADCCELDPFAECPAKDIRSAYEHWAKDNGVRFTLSRQKLAEKLKARGCEQFKGAGGVRLWRGIAVENSNSGVSGVSGDTFHNSFSRGGSKGKLPESMPPSPPSPQNPENLTQSTSSYDSQDSDPWLNAEEF